ncbi:MAG: hypothetical protein L0206_09735, partial [Actinobacteria bacterium]|nr:hypothetical protein [Actinomycetota bacterium]
PLCALAFAAGLGSLASAQLAEVMICDPINEHVYRLSDLNGDGDYIDADETTLLLDYVVLASFNPVSVEVRSEGGLPTIYAVSDFPDGLYRGQDQNGDGTVGSSEVTFFFDSQAVYGASMDPVGVTLTADGAVWLASGFETQRGLWRLEDLNGDGDAMDAGEFFQMVDGSGIHPVETDTGVVGIDGEDMWRMARDGNGVVVYCGFSTSNPSDEDSIFRFEDKNGDGDVLDPTESVLFLNYTGKNPLMPQNPDFGGVLPTLEVPNPDVPSQPFYGRLNHVEAHVNAGTPEYFFGCDSSSTSPFSTSVTGDKINGLVFRGVDANGDGDVNDAGEVNVFFDGSADGPLTFQGVDKIVGMGAEGGWIYLADALGQRISRIRDLNADGDAMDSGEILTDLWSFGLWGMNPPITDPLGPFIEDIEAGPNGLFPPASSDWSTSGVGCSPFAPGPPQIGHTGDLQIGTSNFTLTVTNTGPNLPALVGIGLSNSMYLGIPLPLDLSIVGLPGCFLYQNLLVQLQSFTDPTGSGAQPIFVPNDPALVNLPAYFQWLVINV